MHFERREEGIDIKQISLVSPMIPVTRSHRPGENVSLFEYSLT